MQMTVVDATASVADPMFNQAVTNGLASVVGVPSSLVAVSLSVVVRRLLSLEYNDVAVALGDQRPDGDDRGESSYSYRRLSQVQSVQADFEITIPAGFSISASSVASSVQSASGAQIASSIGAELSAMNSSLGVLGVAPPQVTAVSDPDGGDANVSNVNQVEELPGTSNDLMASSFMLVVIYVSVGIFLASCVAICFALFRCRRLRRMAISKLREVSSEWDIDVPDEICGEGVAACEIRAAPDLRGGFKTEHRDTHRPTPVAINTDVDGRTSPASSPLGSSPLGASSVAPSSVSLTPSRLASRTKPPASRSVRLVKVGTPSRSWNDASIHVVDGSAVLV